MKLGKKYWTSLAIIFSLAIIVPHYSAHGATGTTWQKVVDTANLVKSGALFHISMFLTKMRYGNAFSFHEVVSATDSTGKVSIERNEKGEIISVCGDKKCPIYLGGIPRLPKHIEKLKKAADVDAQDTIGVFTLNREFEREWSGLSTLVKHDHSIHLHIYPTIDYTAPSLVDLIRVVRDLNTRDEHNLCVAFVHCKAGRGRSATAVGAYLVLMFHEAGICATPDEIEAYLRSCRPQVRLNGKARKILAAFQDELHEAGSFEALYAHYKNEIERRDTECCA